MSEQSNVRGNRDVIRGREVKHETKYVPWNAFAAALSLRATAKVSAATAAVLLERDMHVRPAQAIAAVTIAYAIPA